MSKTESIPVAKRDKEIEETAAYTEQRVDIKTYTKDRSFEGLL